jgi:hypothetical protein
MAWLTTGSIKPCCVLISAVETLSALYGMITMGIKITFARTRMYVKKIMIWKCGFV